MLLPYKQSENIIFYHLGGINPMILGKGFIYLFFFRFLTHTLIKINSKGQGEPLSLSFS